MSQSVFIAKSSQLKTLTKKYQSRIWMAAFSIALVCLFYQVWQFWPTLVIKSIAWQRDANELLAELLYGAKAEPIKSGSYLVVFSFLYGVLHSLGPGHGKVIVTTYLATHPTKVKMSLVLTVVSALVQALVAILLVTILVWGFSASMRYVNEKAMLFVSMSFCLVVLLGALVTYKALRKIAFTFKSSKTKVTKLRVLSASPLVSSPKTLNQSMTLAPGQLKNDGIEQSHSSCSCGHDHVADADAINGASTWREYLGIVFSIGLRPCTGAVMVLLFANVAGLYWMGVISAILMGVGTALTTSLIAVMTLAGKQLAKRYLTTNSKKSRSWVVTASYIQLFGGVFLIIIGLLLMSGSSAGMSPVFTF